MDEGLTLERAGRLDEARTQYESLLEGRPEDIRLVLALGRTLVKLGDFRRASGVYRSYMTLHRDVPPEVLFGIAFTSNRLQEYTVACDYFGRCIPLLAKEDHPLTADALYGLGHAQYQLGDLRSPANNCEAALELRPLFKEGWQTFALCCLRTGQLRRLWRAFRSQSRRSAGQGRP